MSTGLRVLALAFAATALTACGSATEPAEPSQTPTQSTTASPTPPPSPSATIETGLTLQQLGFENGPTGFTLPPESVITTKVDQPNVVTVVLSRPGPQTVEDYLRSTLPDEGFTIDARSTANGALTFKGNGWTGGFTGTTVSSAIVLRPAG